MVIQLPIDRHDIAVLCRRHHIRRLSVFGSALRDDFSTASDVDILVEFEREHTPGFGFIDVQDELAQLLGRRVDLSTAGFLDTAVRERVDAEAQTLYDRT